MNAACPAPAETTVCTGRQYVQDSFGTLRGADAFGHTIGTLVWHKSTTLNTHWACAPIRYSFGSHWVLLFIPGMYASPTIWHAVARVRDALRLQLASCQMHRRVMAHE